MRSANQHDRNTELIQDGKRAAAIMAAAGGLIEDMIRDKVTGLIALYRSGDHEHVKVVGKIAEIATLEELLSVLESKQSRAQLALEKEMNNAP